MMEFLMKSFPIGLVYLCFDRSEAYLKTFSLPSLLEEIEFASLQIHNNGNDQFRHLHKMIAL